MSDGVGRLEEGEELLQSVVWGNDVSVVDEEHALVRQVRVRVMGPARRRTQQVMQYRAEQQWAQRVPLLAPTRAAQAERAAPQVRIRVEVAQTHIVDEFWEVRSRCALDGLAVH